MKRSKKIIALLLSVVVTLTSFSGTTLVDTVCAEGNFGYVMYATSPEEKAIELNCSNICMNGNIMTNGTIGYTGNFNHNGQKVTVENENYYFVYDSINENYFKQNVKVYDEDRIVEDTNININNSQLVYGSIAMAGNINLNASIQSMSDLRLKGEVLNANNAIIMSKYGNISIDCTNVSVTGLLYAPFGTITINASNCNLNNVIVIAQKIQINSGNLNANYNSNIGNIIGNQAEGFYCEKSEWEFLDDANENDIPDMVEFIDYWYLLKDTDGDELPDVVEEIGGTDINSKDTDDDGLDDSYEAIMTLTEATKADTDEDGILDADEDLDDDGLTNAQEILYETYPLNDDTDGDGLSDGDEVNIYGTNPLVADMDEDGLGDGDEIYFECDPYDSDTDSNGILDGDEKRSQTFEYVNESEEVEEDSVISSVIVSMEATGNLQNTTEIENIMDKDIMCSEVVGLVGAPFSIETESKFDTATISFKIDKSLLGENEFADLLFLWYDEENYEFVELDTYHDEENSIVSVETTHFSKYMLVNKNTWYEAWSVILNYEPENATATSNNTVLAIDCSSSMNDYDPITYVIENSVSVKTCERIEAAKGFIGNMTKNDQSAVVLFTGSATVEAELTNDKEVLKEALQGVINGGNTSFNAAITTSMSLFSDAQISNSNNNNMIVLLSDGEATISQSYLDLAVNRGIKIYTIGMGKDSSDDVLSYMAEYTGGKFYKAYTADDLEEIYQKVDNDTYHFTTDTDGDGLYDVYELNGIRIQNGTIITGTDIYSTDTDGDGLLDSEEIDTSLQEKIIIKKGTFSEILIKSTFHKLFSNPVKQDSDDDGLLDGKSQSYKGNLIAPADPYPMLPTEYEGLWKQHISEIKNDVNTAYGYSGDNYRFKVSGDTYNYGYIYVWVPDLGKTLKSLLSTIGSDFCSFTYDDEHIAVHSDILQWQLLGGYNDFYDWVFEKTTKMRNLKLDYSYNGKDYVIWAWKGDYLNLGVGAEVGIYEQNAVLECAQSIIGLEQWTPSESVDMSISLYQIEGENKYSSYYHWFPNINQWWITGFVPEVWHKGIDINPDKLIQISCVDFSDEPIKLDCLYDEYKTKKYGEFIIKDEENDCLWIIW